MSYLRNTEQYPKLMAYIEAYADDYKYWNKLDQKESLNFNKFWKQHQNELFPLIMDEFTDNIDLNEAASDSSKSFQWNTLAAFLQSPSDNAEQFAAQLRKNVLRLAEGYMEMLWDEYEEHLYEIEALSFVPEDQIIYGISLTRGVYDATR